MAKANGMTCVGQLALGRVKSWWNLKTLLRPYNIFLCKGSTLLRAAFEQAVRERG